MMLVTDRHATGRDRLVEVVSAAVAGGVDAVQVREKDLSDVELENLTGRILRAVDGRAALLINGRPEVARALGLGLHLPAAASVPNHGQWPLRGRSVHSVEEAVKRVHESPDYLVLGTIFPTESKPGHPGAGLSLVKQTALAVAPIPVLAIGGIDERNVAAVVGAGASGIAVRGAILTAADPERAARGIRAALPSKDGEKPV